MIPLFFFVLVAFQSEFQSCVARDTITWRDKLANGETLVSAGERFELGFFNPKDGIVGSFYIGIWYYNLRPRTVVWVANRNDSLSYVSGDFGIYDDGNLKLLDYNGTSHFQTNLESSSAVNRSLKLLDSGNLVLIDNQYSGTYLWQSFSEPTDTFLPGMVMDENLRLVSWMDSVNPRNGHYTFQKDQEDNNKLVIKERTVLYWKSDYTELPLSVVYLLSNCAISRASKFGNSPGLSINYTGLQNMSRYEDDCPNSRLLMNSSGEIQFYSLENQGWSEPRDICSVFKSCGNFAICNPKNEVRCECLKGFVSVSPESWTSGDFSGGCYRKPPICNKKSKEDEFLNLTSMKISPPGSPFPEADNETKCRDECLSNCQTQCEAYYFDSRSRTGAGCLIWTSEFHNLQKDETGHDLYVRVGPSAMAVDANQSLPEGPTAQLAKPSMNNEAVIIFTTTIAVVLIAGSFSFFFYRRKILAKIRGSKESSYDDEGQMRDLVDEDDNIVDIPYFSLESILAATDNFSDVHKLGQGGFGPVYKGTFPGGKEIAVKRLSSNSVQGMEEFRNEVVLIAKLQHRNLVRLLGYCIRGSEKVLLYEYMPNKSLDTFIFDQGRSILLDWNMRFDIILGITRGLLYLHQDSRLRIIHRDLKTSNILLDEDMNPKISDFGLARIVAGKETEANTIKVVGTYGYMSPEYAQAGLFSVKSDAFSFGVILLEIISGKRNTGFYNSREALSLLGYAWRLWEERNAMHLVDNIILQSCNETDVMKCINIGLLCVQEDPSDRPTMTNVLLMLGSEITSLPSPKQPGFVSGRGTSRSSASLSNKAGTVSGNEITISLEQGR